MAHYSHSQHVAMALVPKFTAMASAMASTMIIVDVVRTARRRDNGSHQRQLQSPTEISTRHRLITGMSFCDVVSSLAWFMTSWAMPSELFWATWNYGSFPTCVAQGFFVQFSLGTVCYNFCLAVYYVAVIKYGWTNQRVAQRLEPGMHLFSIGFVLVTNAIALKRKLYNPLGYGCWFASYPYFCTQSYDIKDGGTSDCLRGDNARIFAWVFGYGVICFVGFFLIVAMGLVFLKIRDIEQRGNRGRLTGSRQQHQRSFARQAILYITAFFASWTLPIVCHTYLDFTGTGATYWISLLALVLVPSQGLFNAMVYFSNRSSQDPSQQPSQSQRQVRGATTVWADFRSSCFFGTKSKQSQEGAKDNTSMMAIKEPVTVSSRYENAEGNQGDSNEEEEREAMQLFGQGLEYDTADGTPPPTEDVKA